MAKLSRRARSSATTFREEQHRRGAGGRFVEMPDDRTQLPEHIRALTIPPAWTGVRYSPDPDAALLVVGRDAKGRPQYVYSQKHVDEQSAAKFARIREFRDKWDSMHAQVRADAAQGDEDAAAARLIFATGLRPGSSADTGAERQAYGATTLLGQHVVRAPDGVRLQFVGKKGVDLDLLVRDREVADDLITRAERAGSEGQLFPQVTEVSLRDYVHSLDGGSFKTKDIRTAVGTRTAEQAMAGVPPPTTLTAYKKAVRAVAEVVSARLGNTPTVALQSYIDPTVFARWRAVI